MSKRILLLSWIAVCLLSSCGKKRGDVEERPTPRMENAQGKGSVQKDSVFRDSIRQKEEGAKAAAKTSASTSPVISRPSSAPSVRQDDNMRGFDPASEDDSDDNGMSRYMDNTDDEGWD